jgi:NAD(P)-dependent dehydrogenase (short-subunit alcohol dehydrogenase family)
MTEFAGKVAVISGGTAGIGLAFALLFTRAGGRVVTFGRNDDRLRALRDTAAAEGLSIDAINADITSDADVGRVIELAAARGGVDCVVSAAGTGMFGNVESLSEADWVHSVSEKLAAIHRLARHAIPALRRRGGGALVAVASVHAGATLEGRDAIVTVNAGLVALMRSIALNFARDNIRANSVSPGPVDTPTWRANWGASLPGVGIDRIMAAVGETIPMGRMARPEDVAEAIAFLCSDRAVHITGIDLRIDGGLSTRLALIPVNLGGPGPGARIG